MVKHRHLKEREMTRSKSVLTWWFRALWAEDPTLRRINSLKGCRKDQTQSGIPVFITRKTSMI